MERRPKIAPSELPEGVYLVPNSSAEYRLTDRGSRFFGYAAPAPDEATALAVLAERSRLHHDASHHCWAFRVGSPDKFIERSSDAGEPSGTAGRPILDAIKGAGLYGCVVVVTRWFGGTLLGRGGLIREIIPMQAFTIECGYDLIGLVEQLTTKAGGTVTGGDYGADARITVEIPLAATSGFPERLVDASGGRVRVERKRE
ncbi:MAG: YigZ family protein [Verrucomicrobia bacterium]|nr:YigZ family protein [Verrucomicrobiota bacterium]